MKKYIFLSLIVLLTSCNSIKNGKIAPGYIEAFASIKTLLYGFDDQIDPNIISQIPYASMKVRIGNGPEALMILESVNGDNHTWVSADEVYLVTNHGRIVKTQGLPNNLYEKLSTFESWNASIAAKSEYVSYVSFRDPELNNLKTVSKFSDLGMTVQSLTFFEKELLLVKESVNADLVGWNQENTYLIDEENFVWKSVQHISPRLPPIYYEVTKKPR